jgi:polyketide synthase PksN
MRHPLLQRDTSAHGERRFTSTFSGDEFFLRDHVIHGRRVLPGAVYVEMARAAVVEARGLATLAPVRLDGLLWPRPFVAGESPREIHVTLRSEHASGFVFEISSEGPAPGPEPAARVVHCRGRAWAPAAREDDVPAIDVEALRRRCDREVPHARFYERFRAAGIDFGPAHRAVASVAFGDDLVVARIELPELLRATADSFVVHPAVLDGALQAAEALPGREADAPAVPFSMAGIAIAGHPGDRGWAVIRRAASVRGTHLHVDLCGERGSVVVRVEGYATRRLQPPS